MQGGVGGDKGGGTFCSLCLFAITEFVRDIHLDGAVGVDFLYTLLESGDELGYLDAADGSALELKPVDEPAVAGSAIDITVAIRHGFRMEVILQDTIDESCRGGDETGLVFDLFEYHLVTGFPVEPFIFFAPREQDEG